MLKADAQSADQPEAEGAPAAGSMSRSTRDRIIEAALDTLKQDGFAGTSARAIARRGGFNQALIFYHFGTLDDLLLAALDRTSELRMLAYRDAVAGVATLDQAMAVAAELYRADLAAGHITVLAEMIAGSLDRPDLGPQIVERMEPWIALTTDAVASVLDSLGLRQALSAPTIAYAIVALYLGVDLLSHLEHDDTKPQALFDMAQTMGSIMGTARGQA
jgi:AcrR family transcriptional regulator